MAAPFFEFRKNMKVSVKICGITRREDAIEAERLGAFAVGFVFYPASKRFIEPYQAGYISRSLGPSIERVGVFVNEEPEVVLDTVRKANLTIVQLHGSENPLYLDALKEIRIIKAFRVDRDFNASVLLDYRSDYYLLDTALEGSHGGTGKTFDWSFVPSQPKNGKIILAGGLHAGNVENALEITHPWGIDVSTGVEVFPGIKDTEKMQNFFRAVDRYEHKRAATESNLNRCKEQPVN